MATEKILNTRYQLKIDTTAHWNLATNFVPKKGEPIVYQDINESDNTQIIKIKIGDGKTTVINLPFTVEPIKTFSLTSISTNSYIGATFEQIAETVAQQGTCFCELEDLSLILPLVQVEAGSFKFKLVNEGIEYTLVSMFEEPALTLNTQHLGTVSNYGVCDTADDVAAKTVTIPNFELKTGATVIIKFTNANSASSPTLNVSGTGAKPMYRYGTTKISTSTTVSGWVAGAIQMFTYDGTGWIRDYWSNTTYTNASLGQGYSTCSTAAATAAKVVSLSSYTLTAGGVVSIKFTNSVPANATLNINSKGAKNIFYKGAKITSGIIPAGAIATFMYDGTQYHLLTIDTLIDNIKTLEAKTQYFTPSTSEPDQLWFIGGSLTPNPKSVDQESNLGSDAYPWNKLFLEDGIHTGTNLITCSELDCLNGVTTNIQNAIDNLNTIGNQFTLYVNENRLAFNGNNFTPFSTSKMSNLGDDYNYWNTLYLQGGIKTPYAYIETRNLDQLANLSENVQNKLMLLTQGYNELANKIENGTGGGSSSTTAPKVMSIFKPFDTAGSTLPYNVSYGQVGFDETNLTPWVYAPYTIYYVTWNGICLNLNAEGNTVDPTTMPTLLSRGYNYLVDDSTNSVYSIFSPGSTSNTMPNTGTTPNTGTMPNTGAVGTIATGEEMSGDLSIYYDTSNQRWYPTSGWDTSFLQPSVTYKLCIMEWQPFLQPAESSLF